MVMENKVTGEEAPAGSEVEDWPVLAGQPEIVAQVDRLCQRPPWRLTGASALVHDGEALYLELTKPKHWRISPEGETVVGLGGLGGSLEPSEDTLDCLLRELDEEIGVFATIESSPQCHVVYEGRTVRTMLTVPDDLPSPVLLTVSANRNRQAVYPNYATLAIATFWARLEEEPAVKDLYGLLRVPWSQVASLFARRRPSWSWVLSLPDISHQLKEPLPPGTRLEPVWTAASLQVLLRSGYAIRP